MSEKRFEKSKSDITDYRIYDYEKEDAYFIDCDDEDTVDAIVNLLNEQSDTIDKQEMRLQQLEELLELSENINKRYREKLIDMNLKMVIGNE